MAEALILQSVTPKLSQSGKNFGLEVNAKWELSTLSRRKIRKHHNSEYKDT
jgi:hypothetical protein